MPDPKRVLLTINLEGGLINLTRETKEKKLNGRNKVKTLKVISIAKQVITLQDEFIEHATSIEGRPHIKADFTTFAKWKKMSKKARLDYNIRVLVSDLSGIYRPVIEKDYYWKFL